MKQKGQPMKKPTTTFPQTKPTPAVLEAIQSAKLPGALGFGAEWTKSMVDVGSNVLSFMGARITQDVQTQHAMMKAKDVIEFQHIQAQYFQRMMDDYAAETAKLMTFGKALGVK